MAMEDAGFKDRDVSLLENQIMTRKWLSNPWGGEPDIHLQHIKEKRTLNSQ